MNQATTRREREAAVAQKCSKKRSAEGEPTSGADDPSTPHRPRPRPRPCYKKARKEAKAKEQSD